VQQNKNVAIQNFDFEESVLEYLHLALTLINHIRGAQVYEVHAILVSLAGHDRKSGRCKLALNIAELSC